MQKTFSIYRRQIATLPGTLLIGLIFGANAGNAEPLGDCSAESRLDGRADVLFCEPWESELWWRDHGFAESDREPLSCETVLNSSEKQSCYDTNTHPAISSSRVVSSVSPGVSCISGNCLKVDIPQGQLGNFSTKWLFRENIGQDPQRIYYRYYLRVGENWNPANCSAGDEGGKLPGLSHTKTSSDPGGQCGNGGNKPTTDSHCWSMRAMHKGCVDGGKNACEENPLATWQYGSYLYFPGQQTSTGSNGMWHDGLNHWSSTGGSGGSCGTNPDNVKCGTGTGGMLRPGRWYEIEMMVDMNTPGQSDGVIRGWVDGVMSYEKTNMIFREAGHEEIHVREAWLNVYMGGTTGSCDNIQVYLDQMVLATDSRIGSIALGNAPRPPTDLAVGN